VISKDSGGCEKCVRSANQKAEQYLHGKTPAARQRPPSMLHRVGSAKLQEMLARNKERQHEAPNRSSSTFLHSAERTSLSL
jgi:hypothetical protein